MTSQVESTFVPERQLLEAVHSLYDDKLQPFGRLVRKRLGELTQERGEELCDGDLARLRRTCERASGLRVEAGEGSEWSVIVPGRRPDFVDVYSTVDVYPVDMWTALSSHLDVLDQRGETLPGGRYSCAKALVAAGLPHLEFMPLGQVCHVVQLAMSQKKLLGYLDGTIAPYRHSSSRVKDAAAELCVGSSSGHQLPLASAVEARNCMIDVLESAVRKGRKQVPISTLKRLFRSRFHKELSETALGYTKLSDLLQDEAFQDLCNVCLQERGYVVVPKATFCAATARLTAPRQPCPAELPLFPATMVTTCKNTFIHTPDCLVTVTARSKSVPRNMGSLKTCDATELLLNIDDSDESTAVSSGTQTPALTASPCWSPRDSVDAFEWPIFMENVQQTPESEKLQQWADMEDDNALITFQTGESASFFASTPSDPSTRCVLCLSNFL
jgi:hypothetical protein